MTPPKIVPYALVSFGSMVTRIAGNRSVIVRPDLFQEWVISPFVADRRGFSMTGNDKRIVFEIHELFLNRIDDFHVRAAPKVGPANTLQKQSIPREQNGPVAGQMKRRTAGCVSGRVQDAHLDAAAG